jgi:hypothetical protein
MKYSDIKNILEEEVIFTPKKQTVPIFKNLLINRGVMVVLANEKYLPDTYKTPEGYDSYGRGWLDKRSGRIDIDGGIQGSMSGHPQTASNNFYWASKYSAPYKDLESGKTYNGVLYISGKTHDSEKWIEQNIVQIVTMINRKLPQNTLPAFKQFKRALASQQQKKAASVYTRDDLSDYEGYNRPRKPYREKTYRLDTLSLEDEKNMRGKTKEQLDQEESQRAASTRKLRKMASQYQYIENREKFKRDLVSAFKEKDKKIQQRKEKIKQQEEERKKAEQELKDAKRKKEQEQNRINAEKKEINLVDLRRRLEEVRKKHKFKSSVQTNNKEMIEGSPERKKYLETRLKFFRSIKHMDKDDYEDMKEVMRELETYQSSININKDGRLKKKIRNWFIPKI